MRNRATKKAVSPKAGVKGVINANTMSIELDNIRAWKKYSI